MDHNWETMTLDEREEGLKAAVMAHPRVLWARTNNA